MADKASLVEVLLDIQKELSHAKASATNPHFKSQYVPFEALWDYAKENLNAHGVLIQQLSMSARSGRVLRLCFTAAAKRSALAR